MIPLTDTDHVLNVILAGAPGVPLTFVCSYGSVSSSGNWQWTGVSSGTIPDGNETILVAAPGASEKKIINDVKIFNADAAAATVHVYHSDGATDCTEAKVILAVGYCLSYGHDGHWRVYDTYGREVNVVAGSIDATAIGATTPSTGAFTTLSASGLATFSTTDTITANVAQTQGNGALTKTVNCITVCANANDCVTLPAAVAGLVCIVSNQGAETARVWPATGDNIDDTGVDTTTTLAANKTKLFVAVDDTNWYSILTA